jgi:hypothetical protein
MIMQISNHRETSERQWSTGKETNWVSWIMDADAVRTGVVLL